MSQLSLLKSLRRGPAHPLPSVVSATAATLKPVTRGALSLQRAASEVPAKKAKKKSRHADQLNLQMLPSWFAILDLKDANFHVSMHQVLRQCLRFQCKGLCYQYSAFLFGLATAPRVFKKCVFMVTDTPIEITRCFHLSLPGWLALHGV